MTQHIYNVCDEEGAHLFKLRTHTQMLVGDVIRGLESSYTVIRRIVGTIQDTRANAYTYLDEPVLGRVYGQEAELVVRFEA